MYAAEVIHHLPVCDRFVRIERSHPKSNWIEIMAADDTTDKKLDVGGSGNDDANVEEEMDAEGLLKKGYDVILCGTGLTQSILAAALARAGKSILHCDSNDFYGDMDAVLSLGSLNDWSSDVANRACDVSSRQSSSDGRQIPLEASESFSSLRIESTSNAGLDSVVLEQGMVVVTPYGQGTLLTTPINNNDSASLPVQLHNWTMANGKSPIAYFGNEAELTPLNTFLYKKYILSQQRSFALDLAPALLYANGDAVTGMIDSGVSEYCEFKSVIGLHLFMKNQQNRGGSNKSSLSRAPCSKRDVFQTKLLSPMDKRRLMKFLQIASDYAVAMSTPNTVATSTGQDNEDSNGGSESNGVEEEVVMSLNERQLKQGRSLYRPQNKTVATTDLEVLQKCIREGMDFETYLKEHHKLSDNMNKIVIHAMAMGSSSVGKSGYSTKDGMNDLCDHLQSLGKYGGTAFLMPLYGSGELSQAFCRSAAVHGGTYLLRRGPKSVMIDESGNVCGVVLNGCTYSDSEKVPMKSIPASNVILPMQMLQKDSSKVDSGGSNLRIHRRISILRGKLVKNEEDDDAEQGDEQRHVIIIPPGDSDIGNESVIHGIALDESVKISPYPMNDGFDTTVLYLTTIAKANGSADNDNSVSGSAVLEKAVQTFSDDSLMELFHLSFSHEAEAEQDVTKDAKVKGMHLCHPRGMTLTVESAFIEAKRIFEEICPNGKFLKLSEEMDDLVKERRVGQDEDEDDEVKMLESAMNMITTAETATETDSR